MHRIGFALFLLAAAIAPAAHAFKYHGERVLIPIIGRFPGLGGTQWQTDVFVSNRSSAVVTATLTFHTGATPLVRTVTLQPFSSATLRDVVLNTYGLPNAGGPLEITVGGGVSTEARARIYNVGNPAGEFGQSVPGIGTFRLNAQAYIYGVSGIGGNRVNAGVTNPNDTPVDVTIRVTDGSNNLLATRTDTVGPLQNRPYNDIFGLFGITPREGVNVEMFSASGPIYGYVSEVRNDTGDAIFIVGSSPNN